MEKVEKDGKIAVLFSPGFGAGWSSWSRGHAAALCMDARIVQPFLTGENEAALSAARAICPDLYAGGFDSLEVKWVEKGSAFEIEEYDGSETVHVLGDRDYLIA